MDLNQRKQQFSFAYARAVAAVAGFEVNDIRVDIDGIDVTFIGYGDAAPRIDVQMKCSAVCDVTANEVVYDLPVPNYEKLRSTNVLVPRLLVLVVVPEKIEDWLHHTEDQLALRRCGYYLSLRGKPPTANESTIRVKLPRSQVLTPETLSGLMSIVAEKGAP